MYIILIGNFNLWTCVCVYGVIAQHKPIAGYTHEHALSSEKHRIWTLLTVTSVKACPSGIDNPGTITQLQLHPWLKFTTALLRGQGHWPGWVALKSDNKLVSWPSPYQVKDSSLDSSGCPEMMTMDAWRNAMDRIQDDVRWEDKGK